MAQFIGGIVKALVNLRKPILIVLVCLGTLMIWDSLVNPQNTPIYIQALYALAIFIILVPVMKLIIQKL